MCIPFLPFPPIPSSFPSPPLPLEVGPLKSSYGVWGSAVSSPSGEAHLKATNDFTTFLPTLYYCYCMVVDFFVGDFEFFFFGGGGRFPTQRSLE